MRTFAANYARMIKRLTPILIGVLLTAIEAVAQKPVFESSRQGYGYQNDNGSWRIMPRFQCAGEFEGGARKWAVVKENGRWGCIDIDGHLICRNIFPNKEIAHEAGKQWEAMAEPGQWVYPARNATDGMWGYVDYYGRWKYQPEYQSANPHQGYDPKRYATVKKNDRWGCIDGRGVMVINNVFHNAEQAEEAGRQWAIGRNYYTWRMPVSSPTTGLWGYADYLGRWAVKPIYEDCGQMGIDNNYPYAQVKQEGRWGNIDRDGNVITSPIFLLQADAAAALLQYEHKRPLEDWRFPTTNPANGKWGWVDWSGEWRIKPIYEEVTHFANDTGLFATAKLDDYWLVIGDTGDYLSRNVFSLSSEAWTAGHEWDTHQELGHWLYPIKDRRTQAWGYVDYRGDWVIKPTFEDAKLFTYVWNNRVAPAKMDGKWGCIDHTGQFVVKNIYPTSAEAQVAGRRWAEGRKF